jgi:hypothetical protein
MNRHLPIMIALGVGSAVLYAAALSGSPVGVILAYLAQLPLFAAGLSLGLAGGLIAAGVATAALALFGGLAPGIVFAVTTALPAAVFIALALRKRTWTDGQEYWYPAGHLVRAMAVWSVALLIGAAVAANIFGDGFQAQVKALIESLSASVAEITGQAVAPGAVDRITLFLPGITGWSWMAMVTINGLLAQAIVKRFRKNVRPSFRMSEVEIPVSWCAMFAASAAAGTILPSDIGYTSANLAVMIAYPLFLQGLSVIHAAFSYWNVPTVGYVAFYVVVVVLSWLMFLLVAIGLAEPLIKLRGRLTRPGNT